MLALAGCGGGKSADGAGTPAAASASASAAAPAAPSATAASAPPVAVTLVRVQPRPFTVSLDATGTVTAVSSVDVKPQVSAQVLAVHVKEGQFVQRGQALFTLDARADQANLKKAEAQLLKDQATLADAQRQWGRAKDLLARNFVSQGAVDTARANVEAQQAVLVADRAAVDAVKVQLSYSRIVAPSAGRVGSVAIFPGSSVTPTGPALLTITQIDPILVAFNLPQRHLPDALHALAHPAAGLVSALLPGGGAARTGRIVFVDSVVDAASGTVKAKALFANRELALWPGAFVNVRMALQTLADALVLPQAAIVQGPRGASVFVADGAMQAQQRPVTLRASAGTEVVVDGVQAGDRVVVDGRQNVRPGALLVERAAERPRGGASAAAGSQAASAARSAP